MNEDVTTSSEPCSVRRFQARDRNAVLNLSPVDVMHRQADLEVADSLTTAVEGAIAGENQLWVAEASGRIVGLASLVPNTGWVAHLTWLWVAADLAERHAVAIRLAEVAIGDAWERGYLRLVVHSDLPPSPLRAFLHDLGFEFIREHLLNGDHVLEFLQNLYERPRRWLARGCRRQGSGTGNGTASE